MKKIILISAVLFFSLFGTSSLFAKECKFLIIKTLDDSSGVVYPQIKDVEKRDIEGRSYTFATINGIRGMIANEGNLLAEMARVADIPFIKFLKYNDLANSTYDVKVGEVYYLAPKGKTASRTHHVLLEGENFRKVAQKYGIQMKYIYKYNRLKATQIPQVGLLVWLQKKRPKKVAPEIRQETEETNSQNTNVANTDNQNDTTNQANQNKVDETLSTHGVIDNTLDTGTGNEEVDEELQNEFAKLKNEGIIPDKEGETNTINTQDIAKATSENTLLETDTTSNEIAQDQGVVRYATKEDGETLYSIAVAHGISTDQIREWNNIKGMEIPKKGTLIIVGVAGQQSTEEETVAGISIVDPETGKTETVQDTSMQINDAEEFILPIPNTDLEGSNFGDLLSRNSASPDIHIIERGETLWGISQMYNLNVDDLRKWNALINKNEISHGAQLVLKSSLALPFDESTIDDMSSSQDSNADTEIQTGEYSVGEYISEGGNSDYQSGDNQNTTQATTTKHAVLDGETLTSIAQKYNTTAAILKDINGMPEDFDDKGIVAGDVLDLPSTTSTQAETTDNSSTTTTDDAYTDDSTTTSQDGGYTDDSNTTTDETSTSQKSYHTVTKGETLYSVAQKYGITVDRLKELNNRRSDIVYANEELVVRDE